MPAYRRLVWVVLALTSIFLTSCEDNEPTAVAPIPPCEMDNTTCLSVTLRGEDAAYSFVVDLDGPTHALIWEVRGATLSNYAPGQRIMVDVTFSPPVVVRYDHDWEQFNLAAGSLDCVDRFGSARATSRSVGWPAVGAYVFFQGGCTTGESNVVVWTEFALLVAGDALESLSFDFVVPANYANDEPILPSDLPVLRAWLGTSFSRIDNHADPSDPPIWPGTYPDSLASESVLSSSKHR